MNKFFDHLKNNFEFAFSDASRGDFQNGLDNDQYAEIIYKNTEGMIIFWNRARWHGFTYMVETRRVSQDGIAMQSVR